MKSTKVAGKKLAKRTIQTVDVSGRLRSSLRKSLLAWYQENRRTLPFRDAPTPYGVWVSEVMLQQTRVETVKPYFKRWMDAFPDLASLARAREVDVLHLWQGLGYYSRARRLLAGATYVASELSGELPSSPEELMQIPGIGPYTAGAISSIAFDRPSPVVDGNVIRVLSRLFALRGDPARASEKARLWKLAGELVPLSGAGDFNQALMELGALVCTPRSPICLACPWRRSCLAYKSNDTKQFPELAVRPPPTPLSMVTVLVSHRGRYAVSTLGAKARWWAGLSAFPFIEATESSQQPIIARKFAKEIAGTKELGTLSALAPIVHSVTRYRITLTPYLVKVSARNKSDSAYRWLTLRQLSELALPAPHRRVLKLLLDVS